MTEILRRQLIAPFPMNGPDPQPSAPAFAQLPLRLRTFRWLLSVKWPQPKGLRLLDLGAGPGLFARIASRHGFQVVAVDARRPWTLADVGEGRSDGQAPGEIDQREFEFVQKDLRDIDDMSGFGVIACIGVLYHLPLADQQRLLARSAKKTLIVDTEIYDPAYIPAAEASRFEAVTTPEGYHGAYCRERGRVYSSYGNEVSFWFDKSSLLRFFADSGRSTVSFVEPSYFSAFGPRCWAILEPQ